MRAKRNVVTPLNQLLVLQIKKSGVEVEVFQGDRPRYQGLRTLNPIEKLFNDGFLTREEKCAGEKYQQSYALANKDHHARPNAVYNGLPRSAVSTKPMEGGLEQDELDARKFVSIIRREVFAASRPRQISGFKDFKTPGARKFSRDLKLPQILQYLFEQQIYIRNVEVLTGINHADIPARAKKICEILLEI